MHHNRVFNLPAGRPLVAYLSDRAPGKEGENAGDSLINASVHCLLSGICLSDSLNLYRQHLPRTPPDTSVAALVYAGMPQFGARDEPTKEELAWARLRGHWPLAPALNLGCGTGYSLSSNRLEVAIDMASKPFNREYYGSQQAVFFACRDRISHTFLELVGLSPNLSLCPSFYAPRLPCLRRKPFSLLLALADPSRKMSAHECCAVPFDLEQAIKELLKLFPNSAILCQEPAELEWCHSLGAADIFTPRNGSEMSHLISQCQALFSMRVHSTVCALNNCTPVIHLAIDGRSDLLTPAMSAGLEKLDIFETTNEVLIDKVKQLLSSGAPCDISPLVADHHQRLSEQLEEFFKASPISAIAGARASSSRVLTNTRTQVKQRSVFLHADFSAHKATPLMNRGLKVAASEIGRHSVYGPYCALPVGRYRVRYDLEWWGRFSHGSSEVEIDVSDGDARPLASMRIPIRTAIQGTRELQIEFDHLRPERNLEFRLEFFGHEPSLYIVFHGVEVALLQHSTSGPSEHSDRGGKKHLRAA